MPVIHDYKCQKDGWTFESTEETPKCPECGGESKRLVSFRNSRPTFTEKIYPFYHAGIGEVVRSESHLNRRCSELGLYSKHEGAYMTHKHERRILEKRLDHRPREVVEKVTWSGRGANLPVFETSDSETGGAGESESAASDYSE